MRPATPTWIVYRWATNTYYPTSTGAWSGQPIKAVHPAPSGGFTPGAVGDASADYFNDLFSKLALTDIEAKAAIAALNTYVGQLPVLSFAKTSLVNTINRGPVYDGVTRRWVLDSFDAGLVQRPYFSFDGKTWISGGYPSTPTLINGMGVSPSGHVVAIDAGGVSNKVFHLQPGSVTWVPFSAGTTRTLRFTEVLYLASVDKFVAIGFDFATGTTAVVLTGRVDEDWTDTSSGIPAALANKGGWRAAASPTLIVAIDVNSTSAGTHNYATTVDGVSWTLQGSLPLIAGEVARTIGYSAADGFLVQTSMPAGQMRTLRSVDGVNWTVRNTIVTPNWFPYSIIYAEGVWALVTEMSIGLDTRRTTILYSVDGGTTWHYTDTGTRNSGGTPRIATDGQRFLMSASNDAFVSSVATGDRPAIL